MKIVTATDANRHFSEYLKEASEGEEIRIESRGKLVAELIPIKKADSSRAAARSLLFERLRRNKPALVAGWTREELYER
jgi:prevent-host-death family protein